MVFDFNYVGAKYTVSVCGAVTVPVHVVNYWKNTKSELRKSFSKTKYINGMVRIREIMTYFFLTLYFVTKCEERAFKEITLLNMSGDGGFCNSLFGSEC